MRKSRRGLSYRKRVEDVNRIYEEHVKSGLSNRMIWLKFIYPAFAISERTFYNMLKAPARLGRMADLPRQLSLFPDDFFDNQDNKNDEQQ